MKNTVKLMLTLPVLLAVMVLSCAVSLQCLLILGLVKLGQRLLNHQTRTAPLYAPNVIQINTILQRRNGSLRMSCYPKDEEHIEIGKTHD